MSARQNPLSKFEELMERMIENPFGVISLNLITSYGFRYSFSTVNNNTSFNIHNNFEYLLLNLDVKEMKIYYENNIIYETNDFMSLFK